VLVPACDPAARWFLLRTKPRQERRVAEALPARGIEAYLPRVLEPDRRAFEPKGPVPLFPGYVFARLRLPERWAAAHYCPGAAGLVRMGEGFAALEDEAVVLLRAHEGDRGYVFPAQPRRELRVGTRVRVSGGLLRGLEGVVTRFIPARRRVQILLALSWRGSLEVDARTVRCA
jgi:transcription antitermination factor NusG